MIWGGLRFYDAICVEFGEAMEGFLKRYPGLLIYLLMLLRVFDAVTHDQKFKKTALAPKF